ncbi:hypothetical protein [Paludisphaera mucosa]|uniref:Uncharacterized protein n=1 Tax=Paludisphaera mucosa TaxID=3030827 RepID=A0ABT6F8Z3_9BACT|nr:hypothetical protein [Paludisphaera mucosa]MDG3003850.1 hypothetical protein [Paludisphaera mucosa]
MHDEDQIPIWLFIGVILVIYGVLIFGAGLYALISPPPPDARVALFDLHADVWWGFFMTVIGLIYVVRFRPRHHAPRPPVHS